MKNPTSTPRFIRAYQQGNNLRWCACMSARRVVERKETYTVAKELAINGATVMNMAQASWMYLQLRKYAGKKGKAARLHEIRHALTYTHFAYAGRFSSKFDIPVKDLFNILDEAADPNNKASSRDLADYLQGEYGSIEENDAMWMPSLHATLRELERLLNNFATPHDVKERIREVKAFLANYL